MLDCSKGSIVNIASVHSFQIIPHTFPYPVAKHAVVGLTRSLAVEYAAKGFRVNSICPGDVEGNMMKYAIRKIAKFSNKKESIIYNNYISNIPLKRFAKPSEIADACFYLSNSKYIIF